MDDKDFGRDERGHWAPARRISYGPLMAVPWDVRAVLKWFFGYPGFLFPWTIGYALLAIVIWQWLTPSLEVMQTLSPGWVLFIFARNMLLALGALALALGGTPALAAKYGVPLDALPEASFVCGCLQITGDWVGVFMKLDELEKVADEREARLAQKTEEAKA